MQHKKKYIEFNRKFEDSVLRILNRKFSTNNWTITRTPTHINIFGHADITIKTKKGTAYVDLKQPKGIVRSETNNTSFTQNDIGFWVELCNNEGYPGWLFGFRKYKYHRILQFKKGCEVSYMIDTRKLFYYLVNKGIIKENVYDEIQRFNDSGLTMKNYPLRNRIGDIVFYNPHDGSKLYCREESPRIGKNGVLERPKDIIYFVTYDEIEKNNLYTKKIEYDDNESKTLNANAMNKRI